MKKIEVIGGMAIMMTVVKKRSRSNGIRGRGIVPTRAMNEMIFHSLTNDLVSGARFEGSGRNIIFTTVIRTVEMEKKNWFSSLSMDVFEMFMKVVC